MSHNIFEDFDRLMAHLDGVPLGGPVYVLAGYDPYSNILIVEMKINKDQFVALAQFTDQNYIQVSPLEMGTFHKLDISAIQNFAVTDVPDDISGLDWYIEERKL
jgi:hypothetical protein